MFKCTIWLDAACLSSTLCGRNTQSNLRPPLIWYVESHESDQSTRKTEGSLKPKALANWSCLSDHASVVSQRYNIGVDRLSAPILSILPIIDIGHFQNRFADKIIIIFLYIMQTNILFTGDII